MAQEGRPLGDRVAAFIERGHQRAPDQARTLANNMLEAIGLKVGEDLQDYIARNAPEGEKDVAYWKEKYWSENRYWEAIDAMEPDAAHILQAVDATREEIRALVGWQKGIVGMLYKRGTTQWAKSYVDGRPIRGSCHTAREADARKLLRRQGKNPQDTLPVVDHLPSENLKTMVLADHRHKLVGPQAARDVLVVSFAEWRADPNPEAPWVFRRRMALQR